MSSEPRIGDVEHRGFVIQVDDIAVWVSFMAFIKEQQRKDFDDGLCLPEWVYRGQANSDWRLTSSFERLFGSEHDEKSLRLKERQSMETFRRLMPQECNELPDAELLAYMQHYGVPTRMLDFTRSPLIALYFAARESRNQNCAFSVLATHINAVNSWYDRKGRMDAILKAKNRERHIHAVTTDSTRLNNAMRIRQEREVFQLMLGDDDVAAQIRDRVTIGLYDPVSPNPRMKAQAGIFLAATNLARSFEDSFYEWKYFERKCFEREELPLSKIFLNGKIVKDCLANADAFQFVFSAAMHKRAMAYLDMANIRSSVLFPDFEGAAMEVTEELFRM